MGGAEALPVRIARRIFEDGPGESKENFWGIEEWRKHYKDWGVSFTDEELQFADTFPWGEKTLTAKCPFTKKKQVRETHFAFLGLKRIGDDPLSILRWRGIHPPSNEPGFCGDHWYDNEQFAKEKTCRFRWYLLLRDAAFAHERRRFAEHVRMLPKEYEVAFAAEEVTKMILYQKKNRKYLNRFRSAKCSDPIEENFCVSVGYREPGNEFCTGLSIVKWPDNSFYSRVGISASRKPYT
jgi:hypothetical protein